MGWYDKKASYYNDSSLPEISQPDEDDEVSLLSDLLCLWAYGRGEIRRCERRGIGILEDFTLQSVFKGRL